MFILTVELMQSKNNGKCDFENLKDLELLNFKEPSYIRLEFF